ncbi:MAG: hypothetical protein ACYDGN_18235 [Acidimicrobiales bacterium]
MDHPSPARYRKPGRFTQHVFNKVVVLVTRFGIRIGGSWAVEGAGDLGYLLAQQLVAAAERVVDVQPKLAARVR